MPAVWGASPPPFKLNLSPSYLEAGLRFPTASLVTTPIATPPPQLRQMSKSERTGTVSLNVGVSIARLVFASQVLIVTVLALLILGILFMSYRMNSSMNWYYDSALPYLTEVRERGMDMVRNADASSVSMTHMMADAEHMAATSIPELIQSVNKTSSMVSRMEQVIHNPTIKLSLG